MPPYSRLVSSGEAGEKSAGVTSAVGALPTPATRAPRAYEPAPLAGFTDRENRGVQGRRVEGVPRHVETRGRRNPTVCSMSGNLHEQHGPRKRRADLLHGAVLREQRLEAHLRPVVHVAGRVAERL